MSGSRLVQPVNGLDHASGNPDAPVTLVEYGDYQCPFCGQAHPIVKRIQERFGSRLRFVFRNFPLSEIHPQAMHAAAAAEWVAQAGGEEAYWAMHDLLLENQRDLRDAALAKYAEAAGVGAEGLADALASESYELAVRLSFMSGVRSGVNGTPTFFINGERHRGPWDEEALAAAIEAAEQAIPAAAPA